MFTLFFTLSLAFAKPLPTPAEILKEVDKFRAPSGTFSCQVSVKDYLKNQLLRENVYRIFSNDKGAVLVETIVPERLAGRKLLMANTLWMFLPTLKRPTQVSLQSRLTGEVSNGDIARLSFEKDYFARIIKHNPKHIALLLTAKSKTSPYRKIKLFATSNFVLTKAEFYAISGKILKTGEYSTLEETLGGHTLTQVVIRDAFNPLKVSKLHYSKYRREVLDESFFHKENLVE